MIGSILISDPVKIESIASAGNHLKVLVTPVSNVATTEYDLTLRQVEILNLIGRGLSNRDIGDVLELAGSKGGRAGFEVE